MILLLRFFWLLPLTVLALFCVEMAGFGLLALFRPGDTFAGRLGTLLYLGAYGAVVYAAVRAWRTTVLAIRGKAELSVKRNLYGALGALGALLLLFAVAYPKYQALLRYTVGGRQRGDLSTIRYQLEEYKNASGRYPEKAVEVGLIVSSCSPRGLWQDKLYPHPPGGEVNYYPAAESRDSGKWAYVNEPASKDFGRFYIDCSHRDPDRGEPWSAY